jgi:hypothetical protein
VVLVPQSVQYIGYHILPNDDDKQGGGGEDVIILVKRSGDMWINGSDSSRVA